MKGLSRSTCDFFVFVCLFFFSFRTRVHIKIERSNREEESLHCSAWSALTSLFKRVSPTTTRPFAPFLPDVCAGRAQVANCRVLHKHSNAFFVNFFISPDLRSFGRVRLPQVGGHQNQLGVEVVLLLSLSSSFLAAMAAVAEQSALGGCGAGRASNANEAASTPSMPSFERVSCPANTKLCLQLAIGKWLDTYVLKAKRLIGEFLLGDLLGGAGVAPAASKERDPPDDKSTAMCLSVEAMGSGKLLVPQINVVPTSTIRELKHLIVSRVPGFATATTRIFKGHGGYELSRENQTLRAYGMQDGAVIVATTCTYAPVMSWQSRY